MHAYRHLISLAILANPALAQDAESAKTQQTSPGGIAWFATWKQGLAEAGRTGRPILLVSAAPHCHNVSGLW